MTLYVPPPELPPDMPAFERAIRLTVRRYIGKERIRAAARGRESVWSDPSLAEAAEEDAVARALERRLGL